MTDLVALKKSLTKLRDLLNKSWQVKIKGAPGYHPVKDVVDQGPGKQNHYVLHDGRTIPHEHIEDLQMQAPKPKPKLYGLAKSVLAKLEKGANGDWQKEGYTIHHEIIPSEKTETPHWYPEGKLRVFAKDKNGRDVAGASIDHAHSKTLMKPRGIMVHDGHERKGLATAMYQHAEKVMGKKMVPQDGHQTPAGAALWKQPNRSFGRKNEKKIENYSERDLDDYNKKLGMNFKKSESLEKAAPRFAGEVDHDKDNVAVPHPMNPREAVWQHSPKKSKSFQDTIDKNLDKFTEQHGEHAMKLKAALTKVLANKKHADLVPTSLRRDNIHTPRRRHVANLVSGHPNARIKHIGNGDFLWYQDRHAEGGYDPETWWKINHMGIQDVTKEYKGKFKDHFEKSDEVIRGTGNGTQKSRPSPKYVRSGLLGSHSVHKGTDTDSDDDQSTSGVNGNVRFKGPSRFRARMAKYSPKANGSGSNPEDLVKGAAGRLFPFNPKKDVEPLQTKIANNWMTDIEPTSREHIQRLEGPGRMRAMNKLMAATDTRKHPETGELEFKLHRGMNDNEQTHHSHGNIDAKTSWTPNLGTARGFASDYGGHVASAWVPESKIHHVPKMFSHDKQVQSMAHENEVIVDPHKFNIDSNRTPQEIRTEQNNDWSFGADLTAAKKYGGTDAARNMIRSRLKTPAKKSMVVPQGMAALAKGMHGDWQKEGYKFTHDTFKEPTGFSHHISAHSPEGKLVGHYQFNAHNHKPGQIFIESSETHPDHQRKGLATAAYQLVEQKTGAKLTPEHQTEDAKKLWSNPQRPFGKSEQVITEAMERLVKGRKPLPEGTVRIYSGQKYVKHNSGWVAVTGEHHGKKMGEFKGGDITHKEFADKHKETPASEETETKEKPAPKPKAEKKPEVKKEEPRQEKPEVKESPKPEGKKGLRNAPNTEVKEENGAYRGYINGNAVTLPTNKEHAEAILASETKAAMIEANAHNMSQKDFLKEYIAAKNYSDGKKTRDILKRRHETMVSNAKSEGYDIPAHVEKDYAELTGLPPELKDHNQEKTNLFKSADLNKVPKKRKPEVFKMLKDANHIVAHIGITFKEALHFRADSSLKDGDKKRVRATYEGAGGPHRSIALKDVSKAETSIMHEIGHAIDYAMADTSESRTTRSDQMQHDKTELGDKWRELMTFIQESDKYKNTESGKYKRYLQNPTEVFARAFEVYCLGKARGLASDGKIEKSFVEDYLPDIFLDPKSPGRMKTMEQSEKFRNEAWALTEKGNQKYLTIKSEVEKTVSGYSEVSLKAHELTQADPEIKEWREKAAKLLQERKDLLDKANNGHDLIIPKDKQEAYISKITELMDYILKTDKLRKARKALPEGTVRIYSGEKHTKRDMGWIKTRQTIKEVASIAVVHEGKLLMGQRADNGRWTLPGGHLNKNELPSLGAVRELKEETGIEASEDQLKYMGSEHVTTYKGKQIIVHCFALTGKFKTDSSNDPDAEVKQWKYLDVSEGLSKKVLGNLHSPENCLLRKLGLQKY